MKFDSDIHIDMHSVLSLKPGVTGPAGEQHLPRRSSLDAICGGHAGCVLVSLGRGSGCAFRMRGGDGSFRVPNSDRKLLLCSVSVYLNSDRDACLV